MLSILSLFSMRLIDSIIQKHKVRFYFSYDTKSTWKSVFCHENARILAYIWKVVMAFIT